MSAEAAVPIGGGTAASLNPTIGIQGVCPISGKMLQWLVERVQWLIGSRGG